MFRDQGRSWDCPPQERLDIRLDGGNQGNRCNDLPPLQEARVNGKLNIFTWSISPRPVAAPFKGKNDAPYGQNYYH